MANYDTRKIGVVFILKEGDKYLFLKREHTGRQDGYYMFPGGHVDKDEPVLHAAIRELKEELDIIVEPKDLIFRLVEPDKTHINFFFEVSRYTGKIKNNEPHKHAEAVFLSLNHAHIHPYCLSEVQAIEKGQSFICKDTD